MASLIIYIYSTYYMSRSMIWQDSSLSAFIFTLPWLVKKIDKIKIRYLGWNKYTVELQITDTIGTTCFVHYIEVSFIEVLI